MNKVELINKMVEKNEALTKKNVGEVLSTFEDVVSEILEQGKSVKLTGFLSFDPVARAARKGHNPQTGESLEIPPKVAVKVTVGSRLKKAVENLDVNQF